MGCQPDAGRLRAALHRQKRAALVRRLLPLLPEHERRVAEARLGVFLRAKNSEQLMAKLPAPAGADWGYAEQKAQALRREKRPAEALNVLLAEGSGGDEAKPDGWWEERRTNAYAALKLDKPRLAYELAANVGSLSVNATKDAAFLAGWVALRQLHDPKLALGHFRRGQGAVREGCETAVGVELHAIGAEQADRRFGPRGDLFNRLDAIEFLVDHAQADP